MTSSHYKVNLFIGLAILFLAIYFQVLGVSWNLELFKLINTWGKNFDDQVWSFLTLMGDTAILWPVLLLLSLTSMQTIYSVLAAVPVGGLLSVLLKRLFDSPRPASIIESFELHTIGPILKTHSFPSGHTITIFATIGVIYLCVGFKNKLLGIGLKIGLIIFATLVALSRIMVGAHWPLDCLAGIGIGWISGLSGIYLVDRFQIRLGSFKISALVVFLLWALSASNFYRVLDFPGSPLVVQTTFLIATVMLGFFSYKQKKLIAGFFT